MSWSACPKSAVMKTKSPPFFFFSFSTIPYPIPLVSFLPISLLPKVRTSFLPSYTNPSIFSTLHSTSLISDPPTNIPASHPIPSTNPSRQIPTLTPITQLSTTHPQTHNPPFLPATTSPSPKLSNFQAPTPTPTPTPIPNKTPPLTNHTPIYPTKYLNTTNIQYPIPENPTPQYPISNTQYLNTQHLQTHKPH